MSIWYENLHIMILMNISQIYEEMSPLGTTIIIVNYNEGEMH